MLDKMDSTDTRRPASQGGRQGEEAWARISSPMGYNCLQSLRGHNWWSKYPPSTFILTQMQKQKPQAHKYYSGYSNSNPHHNKEKNYNYAHWFLNFTIYISPLSKYNYIFGGFVFQFSLLDPWQSVCVCVSSSGSTLTIYVHSYEICPILWRIQQAKKQTNTQMGENFSAESFYCWNLLVSFIHVSFSTQFKYKKRN